MNRLALAPLAALLLAGCTTTYYSPVEVTRFVGDGPSALARRPIAIQPAAGVNPQSWDYAAFAQAVSDRLQRLGYTVTGDSAAQIAEISFARAPLGGGGGPSPVSIGIGGSTGSRYYGGGVGAGIGIDLTPRPRNVSDTEMRVVIRPSAGGNALWEGRAHFAASADSRYGDQRAAAARLADALFSGFPGRSGETIEVR